MLHFGAKITQMTTPSGRPAANQFIITEEGCGANGNFVKRETFLSYGMTIAIKTEWNNRTDIVLDINKWDYSNTTSKYRNIFLGMNTEEIKRKANSGEIKVENINK